MKEVVGKTLYLMAITSAVVLSNINAFRIVLPNENVVLQQDQYSKVNVQEDSVLKILIWMLGQRNYCC